MKSSTKIMLTISSFILFSTLTIPAFAGGFSLGYSSHGSHYSAGYGHRGYSGHSRSGAYGRHSYLGRNYGYRNSHNYQKHSYPNYNHNNYSSYSRAPSYKKPCHDVFKTTVDHYGQYHKTGGTMCYDRYGKAYIVSGSRYQIQ
jgi:hypothetical protein